VISHPGLSVEVVHPRNDQQVCRLALVGAHSIHQCAFIEASIGDKESARIGRLDRDV
jgi:hypothetical protein